MGIEGTQIEKKGVGALANIGFGGGGIALNNLNDALEFAGAVARSGLAPKSMDTADKILVALQTGAEAGLTPMASLRAVVPINGFPSWRANAAMALVRRSGLLEEYDDGPLEKDGKIIGWFVYSKRRGGQSKRTEFTWADATRAELTNKNLYHKYPKRMLYARALGFNFGDQFPDVLLGMPLEEEARDFEKDLRPANGSVLDDDPVGEIPKGSSEPPEKPVPPAASDPLLDDIAEKPRGDIEIDVKPPTADISDEEVEEITGKDLTHKEGPTPDQKKALVEEGAGMEVDVEEAPKKKGKSKKASKKKKSKKSAEKKEDSPSSEEKEEEGVPAPDPAIYRYTQDPKFMEMVRRWPIDKLEATFKKVAEMEVPEGVSTGFLAESILRRRREGKSVELPPAVSQEAPDAEAPWVTGKSAEVPEEGGLFEGNDEEQAVPEESEEESEEESDEEDSEDEKRKQEAWDKLSPKQKREALARDLGELDFDTLIERAYEAVKHLGKAQVEKLCAENNLDTIDELKVCGALHLRRFITAAAKED